MILKAKNSLRWLKWGGFAATIDFFIVLCMVYFEYFLASVNLEIIFYIIVMLPLFLFNYLLYPNSPFMGSKHLAYPTVLGMVVSVIGWFLIGAVIGVIIEKVRGAKAQKVRVWKGYLSSYIVGALTVNQIILAFCHIFMFLGILLSLFGKDSNHLLFLMNRYHTVILALSIFGGFYFVWYHTKKLANYQIFEISKVRLKFNFLLTLGIILFISIIQWHFSFFIIEFLVIFLKNYPFTALFMYIREKPTKVFFRPLFVLLLILTNPFFVILSTSFHAYNLLYAIGLV